MSDDLNNSQLDPMVEDYLEEQQQQDWERSLPKAERRKLLRERRKNAERRGRRALYDLPGGLIKMVASIAEEARMTNSQVAGILLMHALRDYRQGKIDQAFISYPQFPTNTRKCIRSRIQYLTSIRNGFADSINET